MQPGNFFLFFFIAIKVFWCVEFLFILYFYFVSLFFHACVMFIEVAHVPIVSVCFLKVL